MARPPTGPWVQLETGRSHRQRAAPKLHCIRSSSRPRGCCFGWPLPRRVPHGQRPARVVVGSPSTGPICLPSWSFPPLTGPTTSPPPPPHHPLSPTRGLVSVRRCERCGTAVVVSFWEQPPGKSAQDVRPLPPRPRSVSCNHSPACRGCPTHPVVSGRWCRGSDCLGTWGAGRRWPTDYTCCWLHTQAVLPPRTRGGPR